MKKPEILELLLSVGPDTDDAALAEAYEKLRSPSIARPILAGAAQEVFNLKDVTGLRAITAFERDPLCQLILAKRTEVFDFGALVFPRKNSSGAEDGSYTYPAPDKTIEALGLATAKKWDELEAMLPSLLPDPATTGGKPVVLSLKQLAPSAPTSSTKSAAKRNPPTPTEATPGESALDAAAATPPEPKTPKKKTTKAPEQETPVTQPDKTIPQDSAEDLAQAFVLAYAHQILPGFDAAFQNIGNGLRGLAQLSSAILQRQDALAERQAVIVAYLDDNAELPELPAVEADVASLKAAINGLCGTLSAAPAQETVPAPRATTQAPSTAAPADPKPDPQPAPQKAAPKASGLPFYTDQDIINLEPDQIDLDRVEYYPEGDMPHLHNYGVPSLGKIILAYGEAIGTPVRTTLARRIIALREKSLASQ